MSSSSHPIFDLSRSGPDARQELTAGSADFCVTWTAGLVVALAARAVFSTGPVPFLVLLAVSLLVLVLNTVVLAGLTGQSIGARVAQTADVSSSNGRPVGVVTMARALAAGGANRDPRLRRVSLSGRR